MKIFDVVVNRDDTVQVVSVDVVKETKTFYFIASRRDVPYREPIYGAFGGSWVTRIPKGRTFTTARAALKHYMERRQTAKQNALTLIGQATKQIASANELLMAEPTSPDAVDPVGGPGTEGPRA